MIAFAKRIVAEVRANPPRVLTDQEIQESKYPKFVCQTCGQFGCDRIEGGQYIHEACFLILRDKTLKFMAQELHLNVKKQ